MQFKNSHEISKYMLLNSLINVLDVPPNVETQIMSEMGQLTHLINYSLIRLLSRKEGTIAYITNFLVLMLIDFAHNFSEKIPFAGKNSAHFCNSPYLKSIGQKFFKDITSAS